MPDCLQSLGAPQFVAPRGTWVGSEYLDGKDRPFAVFNFKYRSRSATTLRIIARFEADSCHLPTSEALQDLRIIPRTPTPVPLEDRPLEELTAEEMRELLRRQRVQLELRFRKDDNDTNLM